MKVSVIIPNYNRTQKLMRAISSVTCQTVAIDEIIVVDDASGARVQQFLETSVKNLHCVKLIINRKNVGAAQSRNIGVALASNEIIAFLDSDDVWREDKIEKQINLLKNNPRIDMVYCAQDGLKLYRGVVFDKLIDGWIAPNPSTIMFRKSVYNNLGGFDPELRACEDHDFWLRFSLKGHRVDYISEELTTFTNDAGNRLSHQYELRIVEAYRFLSKWRETFISYKGASYYEQYHQDYILKVVIPIFRKEVSNLNLRNVIIICLKHFLFNFYFYKKLWSFIVKKLLR